jgi:hypothetical protein
VLPDLMDPTQVAQPFHTKGWVYEEKIDGWRMLAIKESGRVRLVQPECPRPHQDSAISWPRWQP